MSKREQLAWRAFKGHLKTGRLNVKRIENAVGSGTSDTVGINRNGASFWIELKALLDWPKRATTFPLLNAFEPGQLPFLRSWKYWGGHAFVLIRVKTTFYLLDPKLKLDAMTTQQLIDSALAAKVDSVIEYLENLPK